MSKFVLTAQLQLQAPTNIPQIVNAVNKQLQGVQMNVNPVVNAKSLNQANQAVQNVGVSAKVTSKNLNTAAGSANSLGSALGAAARRFASITLATGFLLALTRAFGSAVGRAIEFEKEMLKISQVTGKSIRSLRDLGSEVTRLSSTLGVSSEELLNAARTLSQAGFAAEKVTGALKVLAQTDLAATFDNIKDTTEGAVAILSQFRKEVRAAGGEVQFLEMAMDSINSVSKSFAVESSDLISVVRRTGGVFEAAGGKLNELIALFTSVRATTRETADTIATGFRTIFTRIQRSETIDSLKELGIVLQDSEGKFVGPMEAIARLSAGLKALDPRDFRFNEIVEQLGGFRQIGKVIPLIKQYQTSTEALAVANNSLGSTARDAGIAQQGLGNQFAQLKEKFDATVRSLSDSDTFQTLATSAIKMAEAILKIVDALEPLLPMLTALAAFKLGSIAVPALGKFSGVGGRHEGGKIHAFASGGMVPGRGNRDTVPAVLTPGEFVMRKSAVKKIGANNMADMNAKGYASGGQVYEQNYGAAILTPTSSKGDWSGGYTQVSESQSVPIGGYKLGDSKGRAGLEASWNIVRNRMQSTPEELTFKEFEPFAMKELTKQTPMIAKSSPNQGVYQAFEQGVQDGIIEGTKIAATNVSKKLPGTTVSTPESASQIESFMASINQGAKGNMFEQVMDAFGSPFDQREPDPTKPFDYMPGQFGPLRKGFSNILASAEHIEAKASQTKAAPAKMGPKVLAQRARYAPSDQNFLGNVQEKLIPLLAKKRGQEVPAGAIPKKAKSTKTGGNKISTKGMFAQAGVTKNSGGKIGYYAKGGKSDTVPAMLTPGEYVVKKSAAQSIGYSNLHRMNQSNGVNGYAAGGIVTGTRGNYGTMPSGGGGGGGAGINMGPVNSSMMALAESATKVSLQLETLKVTFTSVVDDFAPLQAAIADAATGISRVDNVMIEAINGAVSQLSIGMSDAAKGISTVDNLLTNAIIAAVVPLEQGMINAASGIAVTDDVMLKALTAGTAPIKASVGELTTGFKKFGEQLKTKLVYFDVLKKANTDLVTVMEKLGTVLMEKADDFDILKPPLTAVEASLMGLSEIVTAQDAIFIPLRNAVANLTGAMNRQAQGSNITVNVGGGSAALVAPMGRMVKATSVAATVMSNIALFGARLETAMMEFANALSSGSVGIQNVTINTGATSVEMKRLQKELAEANMKIDALEQAAIEAATKLKQTQTPVTNTGAGGAGGGGAMAGMGNNLMMAAMMAGMLAQSLEGLSDKTKTFIMDLSMIGGMLGMLAMSMKGALQSFIITTMSKLSEAAASLFSGASDITEAEASVAAAAADAAEAGASMAAAGLLMGVAAGATIVIMRMKALSEESKELTKSWSKGMKDLQAGMAGKTLADYQAEIGKALQKETEASSSFMWGTIMGGITAVVSAFALIAAGAVLLTTAVGATILSVVSFGTSLAITGLALGAFTALMAYAGSRIGESVATVEEGLKASVMALGGAAFYASKGLGDLSVANKQMEFEMLEGSQLLARQTSEMNKFSGSVSMAQGQMALFKGIDSSMDGEIRSDMMDSDVFKEVKEIGTDAMQQLAKASYQSAKSLQSSIGATMKQFQEAGMSFENSMNSAEIQSGLKMFGISVRDATALTLMNNGSMRVAAQAQLGLAGLSRESMTAGQRELIDQREQLLVTRKSIETSRIAVAAQEKKMKADREAADKADKASAQKLAADREMAISAYRVSSALAVFGDALMGLEKTSAIVDVTFGRLKGTLTQFKNDTEKQIASLKSGEITDESAAAARTVGSEFGIESTVEKVLASVQETERIRRTLTTRGLKAFSGKLTESAASLRFDEFLRGNNIDLSGLSADIKGEILSMLEDGLQPAEIEKIVGFVNDANKKQIEMLQKLAKARNNYLTHLFKFGAAIVSADKKFIESVVRMANVAQKASDRMDKAMGRDTSIRDVAVGERRKRNAGLGAGMRAGGPELIAQQINVRSKWLTQIDKSIASLAETSGNDEQIIKLQNAQRKLIKESDQLRKNLMALADQAKLAAAIMGEIDKEKGKRDTIRGLISEFTFASNQGRRDMDKNFMALQRVMQTGNLNSIPDEMRSAVGGLLGTLENIAIGPQGQTGGEIKKMLEMQMANQLKIRATGKPLTAEEMNKIFNQTTKEEKLIQALQELNAQEQQAAIALAQLDHDAMTDLIGSIRDLIVTLQNAQIDAGGQAGQAIAVGLSGGGVVYAAEGQKIGGRKERRNKRKEDRFKAKGTDTVPAMLTEGEYVVNKKSAQKNMGLLEDINNGTVYAQNGGKVQYLAEGGPVGTLANYNATAANMKGALHYGAVSGAANAAGLEIGDLQKTKILAFNEDTKTGIQGNDLVDFLQSKISGAGTVFGGLKNTPIPVRGVNWPGQARTIIMGPDRELQFAGFTDKVTNLAKSYMDFKAFDMSGVSAAPRMMGASGNTSMDKAMQQAKDWESNLQYFWSKGGGPAAWTTSDRNTSGYSAKDLAGSVMPMYQEGDTTSREGEELNEADSRAERQSRYVSRMGSAYTKAWASWAQYPKDPSNSYPMVFGDNLWGSYKHSFLAQHSEGGAIAAGMFKGVPINPPLEDEYALERVNKFYNLNPPYRKGAMGAPGWGGESADFVANRGPNAAIWGNEGQLSYDTPKATGIISKKLSDGFIPDTRAGSQFANYGAKKDELLQASWASYAFDLNKALIGYSEHISGYLKGDRDWFDTSDAGAVRDPKGGIREAIVNSNPKAFYKNNPEGQKGTLAAQVLLRPGSAQQQQDRVTVGTAQLAQGAGGETWTKIFGQNQGLGVVGAYDLQTPNYQALYGEGNATYQKGMEQFAFLAQIPNWDTEAQHQTQINLVAHHLDKLSEVYGLGKNYKAEVKLGLKQAAEDQAADQAANAAAVDGFMERNKQLNQNMDFGAMSDKAGFMGMAKTHLEDNKIFNIPTPRYAFKNGMDENARKLHEVPATAQSFNALFPWAARLGYDLNNMTKGNMLSDMGAKGIKYNVKGFLDSLGPVTKGRDGQHYFKNVGPGGDFNNILRTVEDGQFKPLPPFMNRRKFFGQGGLLQAFGTQPYQSWYNGNGYDGLTEEESNTSKFYFKKPIDSAPFPQSIADESRFLWKAIMDKFQAGVIAAPALPPEQPVVQPAVHAVGGPVGVNWSPRGTDTVPAMLTPGEFVMKKSAVDKYGIGFMAAINEGRGGSGGYMHEGGVASGSVSQFGPQKDLRIDRVLSNTKTTSKTVKKIAGMITNVDSKTTNQEDLLNSFNTMSEADSALSTQIQSGLSAILNQRIELPADLGAGIVGDITGVFLAQLGTLRQLLDGDNDFLKRQSQTNFWRLANAIPAMMRPFNPAPPPQFMATGGMARGTDTVPAMLTPGEFVMKKSAVDKYGVGFMRGINNGVQGFAKGGPVQYLRKGSNGAVTPTGGGGGGGGGFGEMVSSISSSLDAFNQAFLAFSGLSSMLGNIINSISNLNITHTINLQGSLNIPGFSQEAVNSIVSTIAGQTADITNKQIRKALRQRDSDNENRT